MKGPARLCGVIRLAWLVLLAATVFPAFSAEAKVYFDVYGQPYSKSTIAVPPFSGGQEQGTEMTDLLNHDLDLSGFFDITPSSLMDAGMVAEGPDKDSIKFDQWRSLGVELLCKAVVKADGKGLTLDAYLYDTSDGSVVFAKKYDAAPSEWRRVVHRLADEITLAVTGVEGIMSSRVLFVAGNRRRQEVYTADLDGQELKELTRLGHIIVSPSVSPGGKYLAFTSYKAGKPDLYVIDRATNKEVYSDRREGTKIGSAWMDGKTLAYARIRGKGSTIYAVNVETRKRKALLRKGGILSSPAFSPDGTKMVFVSDMHGGANIFMQDLATGEITRLSYFGNYNTSPAFSPKGDLIAFVSKAEGGLQICVMKPDGSDARVLTDGGLNDSPTFSPSGSYILYSSQGGRKASIHFMLANGENRRGLKFTGAEETQPKFMP